MSDLIPTTHRFVILAAPRSGSNLLCTMLNSHPDVLCHHEVFNPDGIFVAVPLRDSDFSLGTLAQRDADPTGFLATLWAQNQTCSHVGFKMTHKQHLGAFKHICADPGIHKIVLSRRNQVAVYVSRLIAEQTGIWEDYGNQEVAGAKAVKVNPGSLLEAIRFNQNYYAELEKTLVGDVTHIAYEDLFNSKEQARLQTALGLRPLPLEARSRKQNPYPLAQLIENFDSLKLELSRNLNSRSLVSELTT
ncbi:hypothetical protein [Planctobacterium marinum]|uniref:Stf0 sulfotransferase n=1 Tax=Planctobacterium marinum TaxID=1631968 RepID=A0AA48I3U1_9ALTE|nr:hypothetical protein MACH26_09210 [Planctobacterium marinum]